MTDEQKEVTATEEDEKVLPIEEPKSEETAKEDFVKDAETVPSHKYNQALRKQREVEAEKRELEKKLAESGSSKAAEPAAETKEEVDEFFEEKPEEPKVDAAKLVDEKLKPIQDALRERDARDRKIQRDAFFEAHPQYLSDPKAWQALLDEMDNSINPHSKDDHFTQLEKAHRILSAETDDAVVESKQKDLATDAAASGDGAEKASVKEEFTAEDRRYQKEWNISDDGMRAFKKKQKDGSLRILS